jgi:hypothetical protein
MPGALSSRRAFRPASFTPPGAGIPRQFDEERTWKVASIERIPDLGSLLTSSDVPPYSPVHGNVWSCG